MLGAIMVTLDMTMVNVALDTLSRRFDASVGDDPVGVDGLPAGARDGHPAHRLGDRALRREADLWIVLLALFMIGSVLCGLAWSAGSLIAFRVLQGLGGGMIIPLAQTILARAAGPTASAA